MTGRLLRPDPSLSLAKLAPRVAPASSTTTEPKTILIVRSGNGHSTWTYLVVGASASDSRQPLKARTSQTTRTGVGEDPGDVEKAVLPGVNRAAAAASPFSAHLTIVYATYARRGDHPERLEKIMRRMLWFLPSLTAALLSAAPNFVVDGQVDEWAQVRPGYRTTNPDDLVQAVSAAADAYRVLLRMSFAKEHNPLADSGSITLLADSDGDAHTGADGFDVAFDFSPGLSISTLDDGSSSRVETGVSDLEVTKEPSYRAHDAEIGFPRGRSVGAQKNLFSGREGRWELVVGDESGQIVQQGQFAFRLPAMRPWTPRETKRDPLSKARGTEFRVVVWNIGNRRWVENELFFRRVLQALQPDIVLADFIAAPPGPAAGHRPSSSARRVRHEADPE